MTIVTAGIIWKDLSFIITQRKPESHQGLKWEFPGGKLEEGESPEDCLIREIREELGIEIEICNIYKVIYYKYPQITVLLLVYSCRYKSGTPRPLDCKDFRWVNVSDLDLYEFAPADEELIQELKKAGQK